MAQYETAFKLKVVQSFLAGDDGAKLLTRRWSVSEEKIRTWVSHYRLHGIDSLRPKRSVYSAQFKLQVLAHQEHEQLSSPQVAAIIEIGATLPTPNPAMSTSGVARPIRNALPDQTV